MNVPKLRFKEFNDEYRTYHINELGEVITGTTPPTSDKDNYGNEYLWASPIDMGQYKYVYDTKNKLSEKGFKKIRPIPKDSVLVTCIGSTIGKMGMAYKEMATNQQINTLVCNDKFDNNYMYYCIGYNFPKFLNRISFQAVPIISKSEFEKLTIKCSSNKLEQTKVANFLSLLDKKIELQTKKIEDLKLFTKKLETQYIFKNQVEYPKKRIDDVFSVKAGGDINKNNVSFYKTSQFCYPIYSNNLEMNGLYGYSDIYKINEESITVTGRGDVGKAIKRDGKYYPIVRLLVLIPKMDVNLIYMQEAINNLTLIQESTGVPQLTAPQISRYEIPFPPLYVQEKYGKMLSLLQEKIIKEQRKVEVLQQLKKGLMQNMFV